jgi:hypothetical protein
MELLVEEIQFYISAVIVRIHILIGIITTSSCSFIEYIQIWPHNVGCTDEEDSLQCSAVLCSAVQCSAVQCSAVQC